MNVILWNALALQFYHGLQIQKIHIFSFVSSIIAHISLKLFCKSSKWIPDSFCDVKKQIKYSTQVKIIQLTWIHVSSNLNCSEVQKIIESLYISNQREFMSTIFFSSNAASPFFNYAYCISVNIKKVNVK